MSLNKTKFARPYAQAAFEYAVEHQLIEQWLKVLQALSESVQCPSVEKILKDPRYDFETRAQVVLALIEEHIKAIGIEIQNFILLLATHQRLLVLPEIYIFFQQLCAAAEKVMPVKVQSAADFDASQRANLNQTLSLQLACKIQIEYSIDSSLLGGFIVYAGDRVMDCSIKGRLQKLRSLYASTK